MLCSLSTLKAEELAKINQLENDLQTPLLAFTCRDFQPAAISEDQLAQIRALEARLGVSLVAVRQ